jgi:Zn-dependent protease with chaperone function
VSQEPARRRIRQRFWLIGAPLIMLLAGLWQWHRTQNAMTEWVERYQFMARTLDAIQTAEGPQSTIKDETGRTVPVSLMKERVEYSLGLLERTGRLGRVNFVLEKRLAAAAIALSALALPWAALGLVCQRRMAAWAMRSREQLLAAFLRGKTLLPAYTVISALLLCGAAIALMGYGMAAALLESRHPSRGEEQVFVILLISAVMLLYYVATGLSSAIGSARSPLADAPVQVTGQAVTRAQAPGVWDFVGQVAQRVGARMPDAIVIGLDEGFFVTEHAVRPSDGASPAGRVLYLSLPCLTFLNAQETAAMAGHELGHFIGEDTLYSQRFAPIYAMANRYIGAGSGGEGRVGSFWRWLANLPFTAFGAMFLDGFNAAVLFWSRQRELAADAVGAQVAGVGAMAAALLRIAALEPRVRRALAVRRRRGQTVADALGLVRQEVADKGMEAPSQELDYRQPHPFGTHPELAARLQALGRPADGELLQRAMDPAPSPLLHELGLEDLSFTPRPAGKAWVLSKQEQDGILK